MNKAMTPPTDRQAGALAGELIEGLASLDAVGWAYLQNQYREDMADDYSQTPDERAVLMRFFSSALALVHEKLRTDQSGELK